MKAYPFCLSVFAIAGLVAAPAQELPERLTSMTHRADKSNSFGDRVMIGDSLYYARSTVTHGTQIWKTDGTAAGTRLAKDTIPGLGWSIESYAIINQGEDHLTYFATMGDIWKTDGTEAGTVSLDPPPTTRFSYPRGLRPAPGGGLLFIDTDTDDTLRLWITDGTKDGTVSLVKDENSIDLQYTNNLPYAQVTENTIWFNGSGLWKSDGTPEGTVKVLTHTDYIPKLLWGMSGDAALFDCAGIGRKWQLQRVDSSGISPLKEIGYIVSDRTNPMVVGNAVHFLTMGDGGLELWRSDGTVAGTTMVKSMLATESSTTVPMTVLGGKYYFSVTASGSGEAKDLWVSDGTEAGTLSLMRTDFFSPTAFGGKLYFLHTTAGLNRELWSTDGTVIGTTFIADLGPSSRGTKLHMGSNGTALIIAASSTVWRSDGTPEGTTNEPLLPYLYSNPIGGIVSMDAGQVLFSAHDTVSGRRLWKSDGTATGTSKISAGPAGTAGFRTINLGDSVFMNGARYFVADDNEHGAELWRSDGTASGTRMVADIRPGSGGSLPKDLRVNGDEVWFMVQNTDSSFSAWRTDGTEEGTKLNTNPGYAPPPQSTNPQMTTTTPGGITYFYKTTPISDVGLWRSDGTEEGTYLLRSLTIKGGLMSYNEKVYFSGNDQIHGEEPWVSDGTVEGTRMLADLTGDSGGSAPTLFTGTGRNVFFAATTETEGPQLYVVDSGEILTRYDLWLYAYRSRMGANTEPWLDADDDGFTNLQEFAFGGDPADAAVRPMISPEIIPSPGNDEATRYLSLTVPVRSGSIFVAGTPLIGTNEGVTYRVLATEDLKDLTETSTFLEVIVDWTVIHPPHADQNYEYLTFRLAQPVTARDRAFLRVVTE